MLPVVGLLNTAATVGPASFLRLEPCKKSLLALATQMPPATSRPPRKAQAAWSNLGLDRYLVHHDLKAEKLGGCALTRNTYYKLAVCSQCAHSV